jgi:hypothetical protein
MKNIWDYQLWLDGIKDELLLVFWAGSEPNFRVEGEIPYPLGKGDPPQSGDSGHPYLQHECLPTPKDPL